MQPFIKPKFKALLSARPGGTELITQSFRALYNALLFAFLGRAAVCIRDEIENVMLGSGQLRGFFRCDLPGLLQCFCASIVCEDL
jgi:hypothetical protein